jgi:hypothetical protein
MKCDLIQPMLFFRVFITFELSFIIQNLFFGQVSVIARIWKLWGKNNKREDQFEVLMAKENEIKERTRGEIWLVLYWCFYLADSHDPFICPAYFVTSL